MTMLLLAAAAAGAVGDPPPSADAPKKERIICKSEKFVGSNLSQRICKTETEWRIGKENAKAALDNRGIGGNYRPPIGSN